jgi:hypothetical protein
MPADGQLVKANGDGDLVGAGVAASLLTDLSNGSVSAIARTRPLTAMTSNSAPSPLAAAASSENSSSYAAWKAYNRDYSDAYGWVSASADAAPWIYHKMDIALKNIKLTLRNRTRAGLVNGVITADVYGSNNGTSWTKIGEIGTANASPATARDGVTSGGGATQYLFFHETPYLYVRINPLTWYQDSGTTYVSIGEVYHDGQGQIYA